MFYIYQIFLWLVFLFFLSSKIKRKNRRIIFSLVASLFSTLEFVALYMTERFVDYRFYTHMNLDAIKGPGFQFVLQALSFIVLFILLSSVFYFISKKMNTSKLRKNKFFIPAVLISFILLSLPNGIFNEAYKTYEILNAEEKSFNQALIDVGINPKEYVTPNNITAKKGKNIIVISIESLEQGFLGKHFNNITPNLSRLSKEWTFYNQMPESPGGDWTAGSLYNHQVGMPAFFKDQENNSFQGASTVKLTGLGHILNNAGYNSKYIIGNKEYAGKSDILSAYGIPVISEVNSIGKYQKVKNGLHDHDLFNEAKLQIKQFQKDKDKPFALFLLTMNTHFPNGVYDKNMEQFISKKDNDIEFSASAVDYLINDLIVYLKENSLLENTSIYIFPDHLLMGSHHPALDKLRKETRQLYLITNVDEKNLHKDTKDTIYQIELPRIILDGAEIKTNAKFLVDFIKTEDIDSFLKKNRVKLTSLNKASLDRRAYNDGISINITGNRLRIKSGLDTSSMPLIQDEVSKKYQDEVFDFTFNYEMVLIGQRKSSVKSAFNPHIYDTRHKRLHLVVFTKNGKIDKAYFGNKQKVGIHKKGNTINFTKENIQLITESNNISSFEKKEKEKVQYAPNIISITSSELITSRYIASTIKTAEKNFRLTRGVNLLTVDRKGKFNVESFDIYGIEDDAKQFLVKLESLIKKKKFWAIASHDAIRSNWPGFQKKLSELNFKLLQTLNGRVAYIAYSNTNNNIKEYSSKTSLNHVISSYIKPLSKKELKQLKKDKKKNNAKANVYAKDTNRFIAHAGGQIDGHNYTNSLEALNLSYKKGFRLFELDIIKTSDNIYVAAHDWKSWARITGYKGALPPSKKIFKEQKIYKKYSPMDINDINLWFKNNSDAILVTDKVNTPMDFSNKFVDKNRLMMELFTWEAVKEGISAKIKSPMPTGGILGKIKGNKIEYLKKLGITDIASSRRIINNQKKLVNEIVKTNINIYAFHLHFDKGKDEKHVTCNESNYFYGMYADKWDFNSTLNCYKDESKNTVED